MTRFWVSKLCSHRPSAITQKQSFFIQWERLISNWSQEQSFKWKIRNVIITEFKVLRWEAFISLRTPFRLNLMHLFDWAASVSSKTTKMIILDVASQKERSTPETILIDSCIFQSHKSILCIANGKFAEPNKVKVKLNWYNALTLSIATFAQLQVAFKQIWSKKFDFTNLTPWDYFSFRKKEKAF